MSRWHMCCLRNKLYMRKYSSFFGKLIEQNVILLVGYKCLGKLETFFYLFKVYPYTQLTMFYLHSYKLKFVRV